MNAPSPFFLGCHWQLAASVYHVVQHWRASRQWHPHCAIILQGRLVIAFVLGFPIAFSAQAAQPKLELRKGDRICLIGNTLAERMQYFNHFETRLHSRFPEHDLVVRNLGWSADEISLRPRPEGFRNHGHSLYDHKADVVIAFLDLTNRSRNEWAGQVQE